MKFGELTSEARGAWLADERTQAAMEWLREYHRAAVAALVSNARTADAETIRYVVGRMDASDTILQFLERGK